MKSLYSLVWSLCLVIIDFALKISILKYLLLRSYCNMRMVSCWGKLINEGGLGNVIEHNFQPPTILVWLGAAVFQFH